MLQLALPVVLAELGWMAMGAVDTMMVGRLSAEAIGAVSIGRVLFFGVAVAGMGLLLGLDTMVSFSFGAGRLADCHRSLVQGVFIAIAAALPLNALVWTAAPLLGGWGLDPGVLRDTVPYLRAMSFSMLPLLLYTAFRRYLQGMNVVRPVVIALTSANVINFIGNWILVFGKLGAPALGAEGAGWATCFASWYMAAFLLGAILLRERGERAGLRGLVRLEPARLRQLLALGLPAALQLTVEVGVFALATALAGRLDASSLAAHQIALTAASLTYMVPLGFSSAAAVRVGQARGRQDPAGAQRAGWMALLLGAAFMSLAAIVFLFAPRAVVRAFTVDPRVVATGITLLAVAAWFQLFDGLQVVATGALRGAGDTRTPLVWNLIGHWLLGLPVGYFLCFTKGWGARGLWIGWLFGLGLIGLVLVAAWARRAHRLGRDLPAGHPAS